MFLTKTFQPPKVASSDCLVCGKVRSSEGWVIIHLFTLKLRISSLDAFQNKSVQVKCSNLDKNQASRNSRGAELEDDHTRVKAM